MVLNDHPQPNESADDIDADARLIERLIGFAPPPESIGGIVANLDILAGHAAHVRDALSSIARDEIP